MLFIDISLTIGDFGLNEDTYALAFFNFDLCVFIFYYSSHFFIFFPLNKNLKAFFLYNLYIDKFIKQF